MPPVQSGGTDDAIHIPRLFQHWTSNFPHNYITFGKNLPHIKDPAIMGGGTQMFQLFRKGAQWDMH